MLAKRHSIPLFSFVVHSHSIRLLLLFYLLGFPIPIFDFFLGWCHHSSSCWIARFHSNLSTRVIDQLFSRVIHFSWFGMSCRRNFASAVGRCDGLDAADLCQWLRVVHHHRFGPFLAYGLPQRGGSRQNGYRPLQRGHQRSLYGQVNTIWSSVLLIERITNCKQSTDDLLFHV